MGERENGRMGEWENGIAKLREGDGIAKLREGDGIAKLREGDGSFSIAKKSYASNSKSNL
jgi:hypothetical protein